MSQCCETYSGVFVVDQIIRILIMYTYRYIIPECGELLPSSHGYILGNLHVIGSKRKHVCETGYQLGQYQTETSEIHTCNGDGGWEPEIQECRGIQKIIFSYRISVIQSTLVISTSVISNNRLSRRENLIFALT